MENVWNEVFDTYIKSQDNMVLGKNLSFLFQSDPKMLSAFFSKYKFAFKMMGGNKKVLEIGCNEGYGCFLFAKNASWVTGIDFDKDAIHYAKNSFKDENLEFICDDFIQHKFDCTFDFAVSFDVIEHIAQTDEDEFLKAICANLTTHGVTIMSTPNINAHEYASPQSKLGHINNFSHERLYNLFEKYFHNVFLFSKNDEMIHTGYYPMAHHFVIMAISPKSN